MREILYRQIIKIKEDVPENKLTELSNIAEAEFDNRAGKTSNVSGDPYTIIFEGGEDLFGCLSIGMSGLFKKRKDFVECVDSWKWFFINNPSEDFDVLKDLSMPVY